MPVFTNTSVRLLVDAFDIAGYASRAELEAAVDQHDTSVIGGGGWARTMPGLAKHSLAVQGFQDFAVGAVDETFPATGNGTINTYTFCPTNFGDAVTDPCYLMSGFRTTRDPLTGAVGDPAGFTFNWVGNNRTVRGQVLHPLAAETATGFGTAATFVTPVAGQSIWATFHVTAKSGSGTITFTVQTDNAVGFPSATTQITSAGFTAVGGEFKQSAVGALAGETHIRAGWTITGFTSVTFLVAAGVN